jgi:outer membrane receptor protein involved in Fe transport
LVNYLDTLKSSVLPELPLIEYADTLGPAENGLNPGAYKWKLYSSMTYATGPATATFSWSHWPSIKSSVAALNPDTTILGADSYDLFSLHGTFAVTPSIIFRVGVDNLFDQEPRISEVNTAPPPGTTPGGVLGGIGGVYDLLGRRFFAGIKATW